MSALTIAVQILLQEPAVADLVEARVFAVQAPQNVARPYLVVNVISENTDARLIGRSRRYDARVNVTCVADSARAVDVLGEAVKDAFEGLPEQATIESDESPSDIYGRNVCAFKDGPDFTDSNDQRSVYRRSIDWRLSWSPA